MQMSQAKQVDDKTSSDSDSIVGVPSHPIAAGIGAVALGGAAGAAVGTAAGPVGTVVGAAIGAIGGALGGDAVASSVEQVHEETYWRDHYASRPYVEHGTSYDEYQPAYSFGADAFRRHPGRRFEDAESEFSRDWDSWRGSSSLRWEQARHAARDAWLRLDANARPGDARAEDEEE